MKTNLHPSLMSALSLNVMAVLHAEQVIEAASKCLPCIHEMMLATG